MNGYTDGSFKPDASITRAEAVTMINRALERVPNPETLNEQEVPFSDLEGHWAKHQVLEAALKHTH